jgi:hypothetical protein
MAAKAATPCLLIPPNRDGCVSLSLPLSGIIRHALAVEKSVGKKV